MARSELGNKEGVDFRFETLFDEKQIRKRVIKLGNEISEDFKDCNSLLLIGVLKGSFVFMADLIREIQHPNISVDFMGISSYGSSTVSSREPIINLDIRSQIRGKQVLLVEDIVDTGYSLHILRNIVKAREPSSFKICALLSKTECREVEVPVDYLGFEIPNAWVEGYGIDTAELGRGRKEIVMRILLD